jgi:predicted ATPase
VGPAAASGNRSELSDADAPIVARICRKLDGIALAIELAASRVNSHADGALKVGMAEAPIKASDGGRIFIQRSVGNI